MSKELAVYQEEFSNAYEVNKTSCGTVTIMVTYYPAAGAMRINISGGSNSVYYILKDHLGSASVVTDSTGTIVGEQRYYPYGETRFTSGTTYTDKLFTGQREMAGLGIYHYGARFYSPKIGRFLSPDSIVPGAGNPQAFNRYSYVLGNPLRYTDPTGHMQYEDPYTENDGKCKKGDTSCNWLGKSKNKPPKQPKPPCGHACSNKVYSEDIPDPFFSDFVAPMIQYTDEFIQVLKNADTYESFLKPGLKEISLLARGINPFPTLDFVIGFGTQALVDMNRSDLSLRQKAERAFIVGLESGITGQISELAGGLAFLGGEAVVPEGGGLIAAPLAAGVTSLAMDGVLWNNFNQQNFEAWGLGSFP